MKHKNIFVTGIDTDVGKTICSSLLVEALKADYWKPVQCGVEEGTDFKTVKNLVGNSQSFFHPEKYVFSLPKSPHLAASYEDVTIDLDEIRVPETKARLVVEGAGGALVPLNSKDYIIDIAAREDMSVVLVTKNYLGSLNHTFLSVEALRQRGIKILGLVFNGTKDSVLEGFVSRRTDLPILFHVPVFSKLNQKSLCIFAKEVKESMERYL